MGERRPWEKSYPAGVRWDAPIERATLPALFDAFTEKWAANRRSNIATGGPPTPSCAPPSTQSRRA